MSSLDALELALQKQPKKPPIQNWQPALSGDIDIYIDYRGNWFHEGTQIQRQPLINLFASILRRENDGEYYLVTPVEKWRIRVDDTALLVVDMDIVNPGADQQIVFRLNTDELIALNADHALHIEHAETEPHPVLSLAHGLSARLTTSVFYRLMDSAAEIRGEMGLHSDRQWIALGKI